MKFSNATYQKLVEETKKKYESPPEGSFSVSSFAIDSEIPTTTARGIVKQLVREKKAEEFRSYTENGSSTMYYVFIEKE